MSSIDAENSSHPETPAPVAGPPTTQELAVELLSTDEFGKYMLNSKSEMFAVFRGMIEHVSQITLFFNEGRDMVLTDMIRYNDKGLFLDLGPNQEMNHKALEAKKLFCVTHLDKVKIQFILHGLQRVETNSGPAFFAALPAGVLRLQRREYYRMATPIARPLKCVISFPAAKGERRVVEANIGDISGGGIGLVSIPPEIPLDIGVQLDCKINLPEVGVVASTIVVRSLSESIARNGTKSKRAGCEFAKLPGPMLTLIQRYIIKIERERKARESGL